VIFFQAVKKMMQTADFFPLSRHPIFLTWTVSLRVHTHGSWSLSPSLKWLGPDPQRQGFDDHMLRELNDAIEDNSEPGVCNQDV
jgi:hypothetical protein